MPELPLVFVLKTLGADHGAGGGPTESPPAYQPNYGGIDNAPPPSYTPSADPAGE